MFSTTLEQTRNIKQHFDKLSFRDLNMKQRNQKLTNDQNCSHTTPQLPAATSAYGGRE